MQFSFFLISQHSHGKIILIITIVIILIITIVAGGDASIAQTLHTRKQDYIFTFIIHQNCQRSTLLKV